MSDADLVSSREPTSLGSFNMKSLNGLMPIAVCLVSDSALHRVAAISISYPILNINNPNIQSLNISDLPSSNLNLTTFSEPIDPFFGFLPTFKGPKLDENSALLNSIDVALQLALEDIDALLGETIYRLESHPEVQITIRPDKSLRYGKLPRRYAVWGLNRGIDLMIKTRNFQSAVFVLTHAGRELATIEYSVAGGNVGVSANPLNATRNVPARNDLTVPAYNSSVWLDESDGNSNISTTGTIASGKEPKIQVNFHLSGLVLSKYDICYAALSALRGMSNYNREDRIGDSVTPLLAANLEMVTVEVDSPAHTGRNPPYFQAQSVMRALAEMPGYMLEQGKFMEVGMEISVDGTMVGWVLLRRVEMANGLTQTL